MIYHDDESQFVDVEEEDCNQNDWIGESLQLESLLITGVALFPRQTLNISS